MKLSLPAILDIPDKLLPLITDFNQYKYFLCEGGRGCIHKDTLINTPKGEVKVSEFKGGEVYSYDGTGSTIAIACRPIIYPKEHLYKVNLSNGSHIITTAKHKFFTNFGWQELSLLCESREIFLLPLQLPSDQSQTSLDTYLLRFQQDVQSLTRKLAGWIYRYWQDYCLYGEQPLSEEDTYLNVFQQLSGEQQHNCRALTREGGSDNENIDDRLSFLSHLSSQVALLLEEGRSYKEKENYTYDKSFELLLEFFQQIQQFLLSDNLALSIQGLVKLFLDNCNSINQDGSLSIIFDILKLCVDDSSYSNSFVCCNHYLHYNKNIAIVNVEYYGYEEYYDMFVPHFNCYFANGVLNHNSGKTQSIARVILYLCSQRRIRVFALREVQNSIEDSVYTVFVDLIRQYNLPYNVTKSYIEHIKTQSIIKFKGAREQGAVNLKGIEGADIVWLEEAQSISKTTLDILIPTIRKEKAKFLISMNRFLRDDPVYSDLHGRDDCLTITVQYFDNPYCPDVLKKEAEECQKKSEKDYNHIWLGHPLSASSDYLLNFDKLEEAYNKEIIGEEHLDQMVIGVDLAGAGGDLCSACVMRRRSLLEWEQTQVITWDGKDTDATVGRLLAMYNQYKPDVMILDKGGLGYPIYVSLSKSVQVIAFDGAETGRCTGKAGNHRAEGYINVKEMIEKGQIRITSKEIYKQLETIKVEYKNNGKVFMQSKQKMDKSPDEADSFMMSVFAIQKHLGKIERQESNRPITRVSKPKDRYGKR